MLSRIVKTIFLSMLFVALVALSAPAYPAENARLKGYKDGVNLYEKPSFDSPVISGHIDYEVTFEVTGKTDFTSTFEGYTGPWYRVSSDIVGEGFIFGKYLIIDPTVTIPVLDSTTLTAPIAAGNATITGDGVQVRRFPSTSGKTICLLYNNTRVEVTGRTDSTDTVVGDIAYWFSVEYRDDAGAKCSGFVFGKFVMVDRDARVHPIDLT